MGLKVVWSMKSIIGYEKIRLSTSNCRFRSILPPLIGDFFKVLFLSGFF